MKTFLLAFLIAITFVVAASEQEYYAGEAEDTAKVLSLSETVNVAYGNFTNCLKTPDCTPLEPGVEEHKYYCKKIGGFVLEVNPENGEKIELIDIKS